MNRLWLCHLSVTSMIFECSDMASEKIDADGLLTFTGARPYSSKSIGEIEYANTKTDDTDKNGTLLEYYRQRCTQFHHERETFMQHIARIEVRHSINIQYGS